MVGAERVHDEKRTTRWGIGNRFSATALCVPRPLHVQQREPAFLMYSEAGDGIVAAVGSKQKATIRRETDTARILVVVRPADVVDGADEPRTGAPCRETFHLGKRAVRAPLVVDNRVLDFVGLHVEISWASFRHGTVFHHHCLFRHLALLWLGLTKGLGLTLHEASPLSLQCRVSIDVDPIRRLRRHVAGFAIQSVTGGCCLCGVGSVEPRPAPPIAPQSLPRIAPVTVLPPNEPAFHLLSCV